jgi:hypothetical protein
MAGKGSKPRPVNKEKYEQSWDRIFKKEKSDEDNQSRARHTGLADKPIRMP